MADDPHPDLTRAMLDLYRQASSIVKIQDNFIERLTQSFGFATATHYLGLPNATSGFTKLWEKQRLDLSVEALVLRPEWCGLFDRADLVNAHSRLLDFQYDFPPDAWSPESPPQPLVDRLAEAIHANYTVGQTYTRNDIYEKLKLPSDKRGGDWLNGYHRHEADFYVFCNVGVPGRTGHDYDNHWDGDRLVWYGKTASHFAQSTIQNLLSGQYRPLIFYREDDRDPFIFAGIGTPVPHRTIERPVRIDWIFGSDNSGQAPLFTDEYSEGATFTEGQRLKVYVNRYERDRRARDQCVQILGVRCAVCNIDFEEFYGVIGQGFIHVHHVKPISELGVRYEVDPSKDLVPVCPNCHAMLHRTNPPMTVDELRRRLAIRSNS